MLTGRSLHCGGSNEYQQDLFCRKNNKIQHLNIAFIQSYDWYFA